MMPFHYPHTIDPAIQKIIVEQLAKIETDFHVKILYACESGSRGWGFPSPDSDYDVRFIYVHQLPWYLTVDEKRDVIELPINDELDISGWELRKSLQLFERSNPTLFEWLQSPIIYHEEKETTNQLRQLAQSYYQHIKGRWHYLGMARNNFRGYLKGEQVRLKKYLYVLRPILAIQWLDAGNGVPPMRFADLAQAMIKDQTLKDEVNQLLEIKMRSNESEYAAPFPHISQFIEAFFAEENIPENYTDIDRKQNKQEMLDQILYTTVQKYTND